MKQRLEAHAAAMRLRNSAWTLGVLLRTVNNQFRAGHLTSAERLEKISQFWDEIRQDLARVKRWRRTGSL